jgi:AbrB family looped-hinge helix DNA binding protein
MQKVKVSPKFQVVIPKALREELELKSGGELQIFLFEKTLRLQRPRSIKELRGVAKGMVWRDEDRDHSERLWSDHCRFPWLGRVLGNAPKAGRFALFLESQAILFLPSIVVYEIYKKISVNNRISLINFFLRHSVSTTSW